MLKSVRRQKREKTLAEANASEIAQSDGTGFYFSVVPLGSWMLSLGRQVLCASSFKSLKRVLSLVSINNLQLHERRISRPAGLLTVEVTDRETQFLYSSSVQ